MIFFVSSSLSKMSYISFVRLSPLSLLLVEHLLSVRNSLFLFSKVLLEYCSFHSKMLSVDDVVFTDTTSAQVAFSTDGGNLCSFPSRCAKHNIERSLTRPKTACLCELYPFKSMQFIASVSGTFTSFVHEVGTACKCS